jgi:ribosomal protein S18 acetylase RimI-like enzyme
MASYRYELFTLHKPPDETTVDALVAFLHEHLDRYGDKPEDIRRCLDYALSQQEGKGGAILVAYEVEEDAIVGAVVFNATGMSGYIPENILVYIAVHGEHRGQGLGRALMTRALNAVEGGIALHVEPDNPARFLYEKLGFTSKYLEMRLTR